MANWTIPGAQFYCKLAWRGLLITLAGCISAPTEANKARSINGVCYRPASSNAIAAHLEIGKFCLHLPVTADCETVKISFAPRQRQKLSC